MTYDECIIKLQLNHFYPKKITIVKRKKNVDGGLFIECSPLLYNETKLRLEEILGVGWKMDIEKGEGDGRIKITKID